MAVLTLAANEAANELLSPSESRMPHMNQPLASSVSTAVLLLPPPLPLQLQLALLPLDCPLSPLALLAAAAAATAAHVASSRAPSQTHGPFSFRSLKADRLSPDGMMQMAFQLAHQRMHGHTPSTYEAAPALALAFMASN